MAQLTPKQIALELGISAGEATQLMRSMLHVVTDGEIRITPAALKQYKRRTRSEAQPCPDRTTDSSDAGTQRPESQPGRGGPGTTRSLAAKQSTSRHGPTIDALRPPSLRRESVKAQLLKPIKPRTRRRSDDR